MHERVPFRPIKQVESLQNYTHSLDKLTLKLQLNINFVAHESSTSVENEKIHLNSFFLCVCFESKHIYVHVPPSEFEEEPEPPRVRTAPQNNHKHVQILFIRAPSPPTPKPIEFPPLATNEEKTLVYGKYKPSLSLHPANGD